MQTNVNLQSKTIVAFRNSIKCGCLLHSTQGMCEVADVPKNNLYVFRNCIECGCLLYSTQGMCEARGKPI